VYLTVFLHVGFDAGVGWVPWELFMRAYLTCFCCVLAEVGSLMWLF
jgi:hypothetical protein